MNILHCASETYHKGRFSLAGDFVHSNNNNGNFICVFKCTIVNLATYRQFTNAAGDWIIYKKKNQKNKTKNKQTKTKQKPEKKISKLH